ncbi:MAG: hybrid sensor histidine kinase/response regulator [Spirochaetaceae bacterium]|nr:hybrid sensor histidine kinase/response regulator [Spirochaetaceae bacterium]
MTLLSQLGDLVPFLSEQIFAQLPMGLLVLDDNKRVLGINEWLLSRFPPELNREELLLNRDLLQTLPELTNSRLSFAIDQALIAGQPGFLSQSLNPHPLPLYAGGDRSTERLHQTLNIIPLRSRDRMFCLIQVEDVSHAVQREKLLARKAAVARDKELELAAALEVAEEASRAKSRFLAHMSHDIRTPLVSLLGFTEYLLDTDISADQRLHLEIIRNSGDTLLYLLNDILDFARIEAGKVQFQNESVSLQSVLKEAIGPFLAVAAQKQLDLEYSLDPDLPAYVQSDSNRLKQVLHNLISNAVKFTERGRITVDVRPVEAGIQFLVEDTGLGISPDKQTDIFESFAQEDESSARKYGGTGLGLTIVKSLVDLMHGTVEVQSPVGLPSLTEAPSPVAGRNPGGPGSRFVVTLPLAAADAGPSPSRLETGYCFQGKRVLLAEDNPDNRLLFDRFFKKMNLEYENAKNGLEAVEKVQSGDFDLILMDIQMPEMDGYTATRKIRELGYVKPVIALTANAYKEDREMALEAGMSDHLAKPISRKSLEESLARWLLQ